MGTKKSHEHEHEHDQDQQLRGAFQTIFACQHNVLGWQRNEAGGAPALVHAKHFFIDVEPRKMAQAIGLLDIALHDHIQATLGGLVGIDGEGERIAGVWGAFHIIGFH